MQYYSIARAILPKRFRQAIVKRANAQPVGLREAVWNLWAEIRLARATRGSGRRFQALNGKSGIKLNLGCGLDLKPGWVNIDLTLTPPQVAANAPVGTVFIDHDLRLGLPLEDGCSDLIYSSHFFEHLNYKQGLQLMRECYRLLRAEGVFRISLPTFNRLFDAYLRRDKAYFDLVDIRAVMPEVEPGTETLVDQIKTAFISSANINVFTMRIRFVYSFRASGSAQSMFPPTEQRSTPWTNCGGATPSTLRR